MINGHFQISLFTFRIKWIINDRIVTSSKKQQRQTNKQTKQHCAVLSPKLIESVYVCVAAKVRMWNATCHRNCMRKFN